MRGASDLTPLKEVCPMSLKRTIASSLILVATFIPATPSLAFGPTCIPRLENCMCTFRMPCPVFDPARYLEERAESLTEEAKTKMMAEVRKPAQDLLQSMRGPTGNIIGLDSIGLDIGGMLNGNLGALGLPDFPSDIAKQIHSLGIDGNTISMLANGSLTSSDFMELADSFGVDTGMLEQVGLGADAIQAIANGDMNTGDLLGIAKNMGFEGGILSDIGIDAGLIEGIAKGDISPDRIQQIAENAGLDMSALSDVGLDISTIRSLPGMSQGEMMGILQDVGLGNSMLDGLGLDASMIGKISSGELPASAINDLVAGTGIDPTAITIPSVNGPISLPKIRPDDRFDNITIPAGQIPGLQSILDAAKKMPSPGGGSGWGGAPAGATTGDTTTGDDPDSAGNNSSDNGLDTSSRTFTGSNIETAAMCATDKSLVSVGEPPNPFGDDIENIDMAISGGYVESFPEIINDTRWAVRKTALFASARAIQVRPIIPRALEAIDTFDDMIEEAETFEDDVIVNDTIHARLMTAKAEKASLIAAFSSLRAAQKLTAARTLDPVPTFPNDSRFKEVIQASEAKTKARQRSVAAGGLSRAAGHYGNFQNKARESILHHNLERDARNIEKGIPSVVAIIDDHETYKQFLVDLEGVIHNALAELYVDPDAAWDIMRPELYAQSGDYMHAAKWTSGASIANDISYVATEQISETKYGERRENEDFNGLPGSFPGSNPPGQEGVGDDDDKELEFTVATPTPGSYPRIDSYAGFDTYRVQAVGPIAGSEGDEDEEKRYALSGAIQYYLETHRRVKWKAKTRRGPDERAMTGYFWNEMMEYAPECLSGPLPMNDSNIAKRPELFDLDKNCDHITWDGGDPGDYIDASYIGGADAALWLSKISLDQIANETGGPDAIRANIQESLDYIRQTDAAVVFEMQGHDSTADHIDATIAALEAALDDMDFSTQIEYPLPE